MERHVKERLIGAAVLVAAAVILIPEMLSGPDRGSRDDRTATPVGDTPIKTYTIDLSKSPTRQPAGEDALTVPTEAPPPEAQTVQIVPPAQANPESTAPETTPPATGTRGADTATEAPQDRPGPPVASNRPAVPAQPPSNPVQATPPPAEPPREVTAGAGKWAVQLGSFSSRATAESMVKKLQTEGYDAFVMPVKSGAATLYRVRIGPMADRDSATKTLGRIRTQVPAAAVVKHP